jgi:hypothetical protein
VRDLLSLAARPPSTLTHGISMTHDHEQDHGHDHSVEGTTHGIALGFRIFEFQDELYFVEVEISGYVDEPESLGATLVFHKVSGIDPTRDADEIDWPTWVLDLDDDLTRDEDSAPTEQFESILRQLIGFSEAELRERLQAAMVEGET